MKFITIIALLLLTPALYRTNTILANSTTTSAGWCSTGAALHTIALWFFAETFLGLGYKYGILKKIYYDHQKELEQFEKKQLPQFSTHHVSLFGPFATEAIVYDSLKEIPEAEQKTYLAGFERKLCAMLHAGGHAPTIFWQEITSILIAMTLYKMGNRAFEKM